MASSRTDLEKLVEQRLRLWRPDFERRIQTQDLCTRLYSHGLLTTGRKMVDSIIQKWEKNAFT